LLVFAVPLAAHAQYEVRTGKENLENVPVRIPVQWKAAAGELVLVSAGGSSSVGQIAETSVAHEAAAGTKELVFILPKAPANTTIQVKTSPPPADAKAAGFVWREQPDFDELVWVGPDKTRPIMRYMRKAYDTSSKEARNKTYKVFHHLYDLAGKRFVTNGGHNDPHSTEKDLQYPHHRGLMFAFNKCSYDGKQADTWHCTGDAHVSHQKTLYRTAGPVMAEHRVLLTWHGPKDEIFAEEQRQMTVYNVPGGTLVEFATKLTPKVAKVKLDGDPQHSGFQFRASNDVWKKTAKETYYLRPDGKGANGDTRNWDPKTKKGPVDLPWDVLSFVLDGKRYSVEYIGSPANPGEKRYSERDYGRFGCYFEYELTPEHPLVLNHRVWLQEGEMTGAQAEALRAAFVDGPRVASK
jgi:hypothetical protein